MLVLWLASLGLPSVKMINRYGFVSFWCHGYLLIGNSPRSEQGINYHNTRNNTLRTRSFTQKVLVSSPSPILDPLLIIRHPLVLLAQLFVRPFGPLET